MNFVVQSQKVKVAGSQSAKGYREADVSYAL